MRIPEASSPTSTASSLNKGQGPHKELFTWQERNLRPYRWQWRVGWLCSTFPRLQQKVHRPSWTSWKERSVQWYYCGHWCAHVLLITHAYCVLAQVYIGCVCSSGCACTHGPGSCVLLSVPHSYVSTVEGWKTVALSHLAFTHRHGGNPLSSWPSLPHLPSSGYCRQGVLGNFQLLFPRACLPWVGWLKSHFKSVYT